MNKTALILILTLTVSSLMIAESTSAQSIPKPSVPQFTLTYHAILYYVPPTYAIDHYTGENITVSYEHWIRQTSIEVTIENQPFSPYVITDNGDNRTTNLYFSVRSKGQFEEEWSTYSNSGELQIEDYAAQQTTLYLYPDSTPAVGQIDFQVQAYIGYTYREYDLSGGTYLFSYFSHEVFNGTESGWSSTQTITLNDPNGGAGEYYSLPSGLQSNPSVTPAASQTPNSTPNIMPTSTPSTPDTKGNLFSSTTLSLSTFIIIIVAVVLLAVTLSVLVYRRHRKTAE